MIDETRNRVRVLRALHTDFLRAYEALERPMPAIEPGAGWLVYPDHCDGDTIQPIEVLHLTDSGTPTLPGPGVSKRYATRKHQLWWAGNGALFTSLAEGASFMTLRRMWLRDRLYEVIDHLEVGLPE